MLDRPSTYEDMWEYIRQADVCVPAYFPSFNLNSTSPTKLIEYMAMGKASVVSNHPDQRLLIAESGAGFRVPYQEKAFADAVVELLSNSKEAKEIGSRGLAYVERNRSYTKIDAPV